MLRWTSILLHVSYINLLKIAWNNWFLRSALDDKYLVLVQMIKGIREIIKNQGNKLACMSAKAKGTSSPWKCICKEIENVAWFMLTQTHIDVHNSMQVSAMQLFISQRSLSQVINACSLKLCRGGSFDCGRAPSICHRFHIVSLFVGEHFYNIS